MHVTHAQIQLCMHVGFQAIDPMDTDDYHSSLPVHVTARVPAIIINICTVTTVSLNSSCAVELVGTTHSFKGFMIQARHPATPPPAAPHLIGQFTAISYGAKTLNCDQGGVSTEVYKLKIVWGDNYRK